MLSMKNVGARMLLCVMLSLSVIGCTTAPQPSPPTVAPPAIPPLSPELKSEPPPSGSSWSAVTQWRKDWADALKTLRLKSEGSNAPTKP